MLGCSGGCPHPSAARARLALASSKLSSQSEPLACGEGEVWVSLVVSGRGWAPVTSVLGLGAPCGTALGQPCSAVMSGTGMGPAVLLASPCPRPAASSLPVLSLCPSQLAVRGPSPLFPQPVQAPRCGQLTPAGGEKCAPLPRVQGLAALCPPQERLGCLGERRATAPCQSTLQGSAEKHLVPACQQLGAAAPGCQRMLPWLPCPPQTQDGPWGLFDREDELGVGRPAAQGKTLAAG